MSERLTVSLEDGIPDKLRTLAGGERKVGAYLSGVVEWLYYHREQLETQPLSAFAPVLQEWIPRLTMTPEEQQEAIARAAQDSLRLNELEAQIREISAQMQALQTHVADTARVRHAAAGQQPQ